MENLPHCNIHNIDRLVGAWSYDSFDDDENGDGGSTQEDDGVMAQNKKVQYRTEKILQSLAPLYANIDCINLKQLLCIL